MAQGMLKSGQSQANQDELVTLHPEDTPDPWSRDWPMSAGTHMLVPLSLLDAMGKVDLESAIFGFEASLSCYSRQDAYP